MISVRFAKNSINLKTKLRLIFIQKTSLRHIDRLKGGFYRFILNFFYFFLNGSEKYSIGRLTHLYDPKVRYVNGHSDFFLLDLLLSNFQLAILISIRFSANAHLCTLNKFMCKWVNCR